jgi:hypothetical protein
MRPSFWWSLDPANQRVGSGGATINALGVLGKDREWWSKYRAVLVHSGGDSRCLPQYSPGGKLFGVLPSRTRPRGTTTVFDETMSLSAEWAERISKGLLVASGDVVLRFDANRVQWNQPGVMGVAMRMDVEMGSHHGVYVVGEGEEVYTFLQKPTPADVNAAGGLLHDGRVAVDIGLLHFDADLAAALTELAAFKTMPIHAIGAFNGACRIRAGSTVVRERSLRVYSGRGSQRDCRRCGTGARSLAVRESLCIGAAAHRPGRQMVGPAAVLLEQRMTTGGGWQDQAGCIFPGAKLLITGPGLRQRIRVQPLVWGEERRAEFCQHLGL